MTSSGLAGGKGERLGRDKLSETVGGRPLLQRVIDTLGLVSDRIVIVIARGQSEPIISSTTETKITHDLYPGKGALGGIYTGLASSASCHNLVVAAEMTLPCPPLFLFFFVLFLALFF